MSQLLIWNKSKYTDALGAFFEKENIVTDFCEYRKALERWKSYTSIIILCELNWSLKNTQEKLQHLSGIAIAKELRVAHHVDLPILFTSFQPIKELFKAETEILTSIGHSFCQLPVHPRLFIDQLKSEERLTKAELKDVQLFSCNPRGIVMEKTHKIASIVNAINDLHPEDVKSKLEQCIEDIHSIFKVDPFLSLARFRKEFPDLDKKNINSALRSIEEMGKELIDKYASVNADAKTVPERKKPWKLLLLDDELNAESALVKLLEEKGVEVICTSNASDATKALMEDNSLRGKISLILCDFRLNEHDGDVIVQQRKQGYAFLQDIAEKFRNRLLSAVVYSGMPRQFLLDTFRTFKIRAEIFSKLDFKLDDAGAQNFLANRLIEIGDENYEALAMLPLASRGWAEHLHETYLLYRQQRDYEKREQDICAYCTDWVEEFRTGQNPPTPMIKGDAFNPGKNKSEKDILERFEAYYKTRRLAQFLHLYYESRKSEDPADIIPVILAPKGKKMNTPALRRGFFSQIIGFKREEFPFGATMEELCWFEHDLGIKVFDSYQKFRNKFNACEQIIGEFIAGIPSLKESLAEADYKYTDTRKHELLFDRRTCKPYLFDRTDLALCLQWLNLQKEHLSEAALKTLLTELIKSIEELWK